MVEAVDLAVLNRRSWIAIIAGLAVITVDQLLKTISPNRFLNTGAVFGWPVPPEILVLLGLALLIPIWWLRRRTHPWPWLPASLLIAGAVSNMIDRLRLGAVIDYISVFSGQMNLADLAIGFGTLYLVVFLLRPISLKRP